MYHGPIEYSFIPFLNLLVISGLSCEVLKTNARNLVLARQRCSGNYDMLKCFFIYVYINIYNVETCFTILGKVLPKLKFRLKLNF
jgi:hypothetical protein